MTKPHTKVYRFTNPHHGGFPFVQSVAYSAKGTMLAVGAAKVSRRQKSFGGIRVWNLTKKRQTSIASSSGDVVSLGFLDKDQALGVWTVWTPGDSINSNRFVMLPLPPKPLYKKYKVITRPGHVFFGSPLHQMVAVNADVLTGAKSKKRSIRWHINGAFTPKGTHALLLLSHRNRAGTHKEKYALVHMRSNKTTATYPTKNTSSATRLAIASGARQFAIGRKGYAEIWNTGKKTQHTLRVGGSSYLLPLYSPDGGTLVLVTQPAKSRSWSYTNKTKSGFQIRQSKATANTYIDFFDTKTLTRQKRWEIKSCFFRTTYFRFGRYKGPEHNPKRAAFSPKGKYIALACNGGVLIWNRATNTIIQKLAWRKGS